MVEKWRQYAHTVHTSAQNAGDILETGIFSVADLGLYVGGFLCKERAQMHVRKFLNHAHFCIDHTHFRWKMASSK